MDTLLVSSVLPSIESSEGIVDNGLVNRHEVADIGSNPSNPMALAPTQIVLEELSNGDFFPGQLVDVPIVDLSSPSVAVAPNSLTCEGARKKWKWLHSDNFVK